MKIVFDCRYTRLGRHDGISRYGARLVEELAKLHPVTMLISDERQLEMLPDLPWIMGTDPTSAREPRIARIVNAHSPDVVFTPMQTMGPGGRDYALVTTVHDLIYYTHRTPPRDLNPALRLLWRGYHLWWGFQRALLNRADAHLVDSETTRDLMVKHRMTRNPMHVVLLGTEQPHPTPTRSAALERTLVYMGSFMPYKNVDLLVRSMSALPGLPSSAHEPHNPRREVSPYRDGSRRCARVLRGRDRRTVRLGAREGDGTRDGIPGRGIRPPRR